MLQGKWFYGLAPIRDIGSAMYGLSLDVAQLTQAVLVFMSFYSLNTVFFLSLAPKVSTGET